MLANYVTRSSSTTIFMVVFLTMGLMLISEVGGEKLEVPSRPDVFTSPDELRKYVTALNGYLVVAGRPRFGKRRLYDDYEPSQNLEDRCRLVCEK